MADPDDPFASLTDGRTAVRKPVPGGSRVLPVVPPPPVPAVAPLATLPRLSGAGSNPLTAAAAPLLHLLTRLKNTPSHPDPEGLRGQLVAAVQQFEKDARQASVPTQTVLAARYVLCTVLDDAILNTPWGQSPTWRQQGLLISFHKEAWGGEKFFLLLDKLCQDPTTNCDLLELLYQCLALGFQGRYRVKGNLNELEAVRQHLYEVLQHQRGPFERALSPHWLGIRDRRNPLRRWVPLWVVGALAALALAGLYAGLALALADRSDPLFAALQSLGREVSVARPAPPPPPPRPDAPPALPQVLQRFLEAEIREGLVEVTETAAGATVRLRGDGLFNPASTVVNPPYEPVLARIATALQTVPDRPVLITGHTDSVPIRTLRFPSNYELSRARAETVLQSLAALTGTPARFQAAGRADTEPLADNASREGRARNRRVEIIVLTGHGGR